MVIVSILFTTAHNVRINIVGDIVYTYMSMSMCASLNSTLIIGNEKPYAIHDVGEGDSGSRCVYMLSLTSQ